ncbi:MAG: hypothetical protein NTW86_01070 [Candidatus Sumerlaeota bacterium]|nr:hypothetical protein [Candidatus Sumerlaeota bacterium]
MPDIAPSDPEIPDVAELYRAILYERWWHKDKKFQVSGGAFDFEVFSVNIASLTTRVETLSRFYKGTGLVSFEAGQARELAFYPRKELDEKCPDNISHANVRTGPSGRKSRAKKLARLCKVLVEPCF